MFAIIALSASTITIDWVGLTGLVVAIAGLAIAKDKNEREIALEKKQELKEREKIWGERFQGIEDRCDRIEEAILMLVGKITK